MARSKKRRKICFLPQNRRFFTQRNCSQTVILLLEELEALRLCDYEHMDQDKAAQNMEVSRGTYQRILRAGREKVADALCNGKNIQILGGACDLSDGPCPCQHRCRLCRTDLLSPPSTPSPEDA